MRRIAVSAAALAVVVLGACGGSDDDDTGAAASTTTSSTAPNFGAAATVFLKDLKFTPSKVTVERGEGIRWLWQDALPHNVVGDGFKSETLTGEGKEFRHTFEKKGQFNYQCTLHVGMTGTVTVR